MLKKALSDRGFFLFIFLILSGSKLKKMKHLWLKISIVLLQLLMVFPTMAQTQPSAGKLPIDPESKKIMYRDVVEQAGKPPYLYIKAIEWFGYYYLNAQSVYSVQDKENGKIEGTGRLKLYYDDDASGVRREGGLVTYLIRMELKEDKYRYTITDFTLKGASRYPVEKWLDKSDPAYNARCDSYLYQIDTTMQRLISTMKEKMKPTVVKKDEW